MTYTDVVNMKQFGVVTKNVCQFELDLLTDENTLPEDANAFFELYIQDAVGNLIDVPVLINNFRDQNGNQPNVNLDYETSRLVRRFFIVDTISGVESGGNQKVVRFANKVKLTV